jgi:hypothetical protein
MNYDPAPNTDGFSDGVAPTFFVVRNNNALFDHPLP